MSELHFFGIRHHGPGSARSLVRALEAVRPDVVLIEGPPDANDLLPLASHAGLEPPVALLIYLPERPRAAVLYPFARFSPEWQAIQYGLAQKVPLRFIDLPQSLRFGAAEAEAGESADEAAEEVPATTARGDPLAPMALAAGYSDAERWWDQLVESREGHDLDVFKAVHEMMSAVRAELNEPMPLEEQRREAHMRKCIRAASAEGFERIAVVCGAWHTPALADMPAAKSDDALLKGLAKTATAAAWTPWSYERLSYRSGYGAGIESPVWYELLWEQRKALGAQWLTRAARLLRDEDVPVSSAHVIEACRLADALASVRGRAVPALPEYHDAAISVLGNGNALQPAHHRASLAFRRAARQGARGISGGAARAGSGGAAEAFAIAAEGGEKNARSRFARGIRPRPQPPAASLALVRRGMGRARKRIPAAGARSTSCGRLLGDRSSPSR